MKFIVNKSEISEAVLNIQRAVSNKSSIPALEGILICGDKNKLILSAYDMDLGMTTEIPAEITQEGRTVMNARLISDIVRRSPDDFLRFSVDDKNMATIESGKSEFSIICVPAEEFPEFPSVTDAQRIDIECSTLKSLIRHTIFSIADGDAKPINKGILFNLEKGVLDVVAVDGYRLAKRTEVIDNKNDLSFIVPGKTLNEVLRLLDDSNEIAEIYTGKNQIMFKVGMYTVMSSLTEGEFLNYKKAIPTEFITHTTVNARSLIDSSERVSSLITDRLKSPIRCMFGNNEINFLCTTSMGRARDSISVEVEGEEIEIGFNSKYLLDALKNVDGDEIRIKLGGPLNPMVILPKEGESFLFLVLPVRLKNEG